MRIIDTTYTGPDWNYHTPAEQLARARIDRDFALTMRRSEGVTKVGRECRAIGNASLPAIEARIALWSWRMEG